jgi:hypothetical protein
MSSSEPVEKVKKSNAWVEHIRQFAKDNKVSYGCALGMPECRASYKSKKDVKKEVEPKKEPKKEPVKESTLSGAELIAKYLKLLEVYVDRYSESQFQIIAKKFKSKSAFKDFMLSHVDKIEDEEASINKLREMMTPVDINSLTAENKRLVNMYIKFSKSTNRRITSLMNKIKGK